MAENYRNSRRRNDVEQVGFLYKKKFRWLDRCVYCGLPATCQDHVLPLCIAVSVDFSNPRTMKNLKQGLNKVPSCTECNSIAGGNFFVLIKEKRKYIQNKLQKKHYKKLRTVLWDDDEIDNLGPNMRQQVEKMLHNRIIMERRILFPAVVKGHKKHNTKKHLFY